MHSETSSNVVPPNDKVANLSRKGSSKDTKDKKCQKKIPKKLQHIPRLCLEHNFARLKRGSALKRRKSQKGGGDPYETAESPAESTSTSPTTANSSTVDTEFGLGNGFEYPLNYGMGLGEGPLDLSPTFSPIYGFDLAHGSTTSDHLSNTSHSPDVEECFPVSNSNFDPLSMPLFSNMNTYHIIPQARPRSYSNSLEFALGPRPEHEGQYPPGRY